MHAHFEQHVYHRHSHDTYSFGLTESGAQAFTCRGAARTSATGMVMAFNPDEPHDGHSAVEHGFTYRMVHIGPDLIAGVLADIAEHPAGLPLFAEPVLDDPVLFDALRRVHGTLREGNRLAQDEALVDAVRALVHRGATRPPGVAQRPAVRAEVRRAREYLDAAFAEDVSADELSTVAGCSRFALHRGFVAAYGFAPSDYQRQLRLRAARRLLDTGRTPAETAAEAGFADQSHLTRWFKRYYGITPSVYQYAK
ncbi:transcriptional regulator [Amycolatopsis taiwanensis]|uniref:Transcriptional regulator n=2 Tax=Amycolatopsis taiwanensis TaxID=342230 RepID=A0A9W6VH61_9PSEU|nr:transcriptional regulator [Amycolatopsis taiwanensis]